MEAWDTLKTQRMVAESVREYKVQMSRLQYEEMKFRPGENVDDFTMWLTSVVNELNALEDAINERKVIQKFLVSSPFLSDEQEAVRENGPQQGTRLRKPNARVFGPEWIPV